MQNTRIIIPLLALVTAFGGSVSGQEPWYPYPINTWNPPLSDDAVHRAADYTPLERASKEWNIAAFIPHLKDSYWLAANYGLAAEARRLGVRLQVFQAGGYALPKRQYDQVRNALESGFDGLIVSAVSAEGLNEQINEARARGIPVVDLINGISSPDLSARSATPYYGLGHAAGVFLKEHVGATSDSVDVVWFPGPEGPMWSKSGDAGFRAAVAGSPIRIRGTYWGDTGKKAQTDLLNQALDENPEADFVVGTSVTAESADRVLRQRKATDRVGVVSYYFSPGVYRAVRRGRVLASPHDSTPIQARIAVDQIVRILEGREVQKHVGTRVQLITPDNVEKIDKLSIMAPVGFMPTYTVE